MHSPTQFTNDLLVWYTQQARPFLSEILPADKLAEFDRDGERLQKRLAKLNTELVACFLGTSGVGKSTLLNALLGGQQTLVPSGGVGPLTAQALVVRYAEKPRLEVEYHGSGMLQRTYFGLEQMYRAELGPLPGTELDEAPSGELDETDLPETDAAAAEAEASGENEAAHVREEKRQQWRRRAQLLVAGSQDLEREPRYLIDCLREAAGRPRHWNTQLQAEDEGRVHILRGIIAQTQTKPGQTVVVDGSEEPDAFRRAIRDHAVGFLAPLIKNCTIHWPAAALQNGLTLVDLPGVGILRDAHKEVTRSWIREKAKALVLVVDHRGITDAVGHALRKSEFLNALLYSTDEPDEDPVVMVAVTRIDDIASTRRQDDPTKRKFQHFLEVAEEVRYRMRADLQKHLDQIWLQGVETTDARRQIAANLLANLQVHPISAPEYMRLQADNEDEPAFLKALDQTGIPGMAASLNELAVKRSRRIYDQVQSHARIFRDGVAAQLSLIEAQWEEQTHAREEAARLREELRNFIQPLRERISRDQGSYREFLKNGIPQRIKDLVSVASERASRDIEQYLGRLGVAHWATLRASVRRGGRYKGATDISLPTEFALRYEEPVAEAWSKDILRDLRARTRIYGDDCLCVAAELTQWAIDQGARVRVKAVKAQHEALQAKAKGFESVGREMAREMRDEAQRRLIDAIEKKIKERCDDFVNRHQDVGPGVKYRILGLYRDLAREVSDIAALPARSILTKVYRQAEDEIQEAFADFQDPLTPLGDAIVSTEEQRIAREDARRREAVLAGLRTVRDHIPAAPEAD